MSNSVCWNFDEGSAQKGDSTGFISTGGNHLTVLGKCLIGKNQNGTSFVQINGDTESGAKLNYVNLYTASAKGILTGFHKVNALLGLVGIQNMTYRQDTVDGKQVYVINELEGIRIGVGVKRVDKDDFKQNGERKYALELTHFFDPTTKQTYTEKKAGKEAYAWHNPAPDKLKSGERSATQAPGFGGGGFGGGGQQQPQQQGGALPIEQDELPF